MCYPHDATSIYDGMGVPQKFKPSPGATFAVVAESFTTPAREFSAIFIRISP